MKKEKVFTAIGIIVLSFLVCLPVRVDAVERKSSASAYLYEYGVKLYEDGNVAEAIQQLKNALLANPYNCAAQKYLDCIINKQQKERIKEGVLVRQVRIEYLNSQLMQLEGERQSCFKEVRSLREAVTNSGSRQRAQVETLNLKNASLKDRTAQLNAAMQDKETKISQLAKELASLEKQNSLYLKKIAALNEASDDKEQKLRMFAREGDFRKGLRQTYLQEEQRKESQVQDLAASREALLRENRQIQRRCQLMRIEQLMRQVNEALSESSFLY
jgi:chromosome segregation ATPase